MLRLISTTKDSSSTRVMPVFIPETNNHWQTIRPQLCIDWVVQTNGQILPKPTVDSAIHPLKTGVRRLIDLQYKSGNSLSSLTPTKRREPVLPYCQLVHLTCNNFVTDRKTPAWPCRVNCNPNHDELHQKERGDWLGKNQPFLRSGDWRCR